MRLVVFCVALLLCLPAALTAGECRDSSPDRDAIEALHLLNNAEAEFLKTSGRPGRLEDFIQQKTLQQIAQRSPSKAQLVRSMVDDSSISLPGHTIRLIATHDSYTIVVKETHGCQRTYMTDDRGIIFSAEPLRQEVSDARNGKDSERDRK